MDNKELVRALASALKSNVIKKLPSIESVIYNSKESIKELDSEELLVSVTILVVQKRSGSKYPRRKLFSKEFLKSMDDKNLAAVDSIENDLLVYENGILVDESGFVEFRKGYVNESVKAEIMTVSDEIVGCIFDIFPYETINVSVKTRYWQ